VSPVSDGPWLDLAVRMVGRPCLVVGGGPVAVRRIERLLAAGAHVTVVSPTLDLPNDPPEPPEPLGSDSTSIRWTGSDSPPVGTDSTSIRWIEREYRRGDADGMALVVAATGVEEVDTLVVAEAVEAGIPVNDATRGERGTVVFPATTTDGAVTITVRTAGASPALSAWIRRRFDAQWAGIGEVAVLMGEMRAELTSSGAPSSHPGWTAALDDGLVDLVQRGEHDRARALLRAHLGLGDDSAPPPRSISD
jgi:siroheme synthase-like protein